MGFFRTLLSQGVWRREHHLTHMAAVIGQRGSKTLLTGSDAGKLHVTGFFSLDFRSEMFGLKVIEQQQTQLRQFKVVVRFWPYEVLLFYTSKII